MLDGLRPRLLDEWQEELVRSDVPRLVSVSAGPEGWFALMRSLARFTAAEATFTTIAKDLQPHIPGITDDTVSLYLGILQRLYLLEPLTAWSVKLRSKATLRRSPKWHFADPALAMQGIFHQDLRELSLSWYRHLEAAFSPYVPPDSARALVEYVNGTSMMTAITGRLPAREHLMRTVSALWHIEKQ